MEQPHAWHHCRLAPAVLIAYLKNSCDGSDGHLVHSLVGRSSCYCEATVIAAEQSEKALENQRRQSSQKITGKSACQSTHLRKRMVCVKARSFSSFVALAFFQPCITKILKWQKHSQQPKAKVRAELVRTKSSIFISLLIQNDLLNAKAGWKAQSLLLILFATCLQMMFKEERRVPVPSQMRGKQRGAIHCMPRLSDEGR